MSVFSLLRAASPKKAFQKKKKEKKIRKEGKNLKTLKYLLLCFESKKPLIFNYT